MELTPFVDALRHDLAVAAEAGGDDARALADRLTGPLESAARLMLLEALSAAADEITSGLAPGSVDVRLRGGVPEFVVTAPPAESPAAEPAAMPPPMPPEDDDGTIARINLRLPEHLKASVEDAAGRARLSVNAWLVRVVATAVAAEDDSRSRPRAGRPGQSYTGWVR